MNLLPRSGSLNVFVGRNVANSGKTRMRQRQNNFKVHVLRWRELLAYDVRKDSFIHVCDDETFKARRLDWEDEFRFRGKSKVS
jgi:hypothetical protein